MRELASSDINSFIEFAKKILLQGLAKFPSARYSFNFGKASIVVLAKSSKVRGHVASNFVGFAKIFTSARLKKKIIDEINQLPKDKVNIIVYNITHAFAQFDDIEDAFFGQSALRVNIESGKNEPIRKENGVIHDKRGEQISAIIAYEDFKYEKRRIYSNPCAKFPVKAETLAMI